MNRTMLVAIASMLAVGALAQTPRPSRMPQIEAPDHKFTRQELQTALYEDLQKFLASRGIGRRLLSQRGGFPIQWARELALAEFDRNPE